MALPAPVSPSTEANARVRCDRPPPALVRFARTACFPWVASGVWTALTVAAMLATHGGDAASIELGNFAVFLALWCAGVLAAAGGHVAARAGNRERARMLAALKTSEASYRQLFEGSPNVMLIYEIASLRILAANEAAQRDYGYSPDEFRRLTLRDIHPISEIALMEQTVQTERPRLASSGPWSHRRKDGSAIQVEVSSQAVSWDGRAARCVQVTDITAREQAAERLRMLNSRLQTLVGSLSLGVLVEDSERRVAVANAELCRLFGIGATPAQLEGSSCAEAAQRVASLFADPARFMSRIAELIEQRQRCVNEPLVLVDGRVFERDYVPITTAGVGHGQLWVYRDVTPRYRMERALEKRVLALTSPSDATESIEFEELFNLAEIQTLQDQFSQATQVASIITRPDGTPITRPSNFTRLCADIIRRTEKGLCACMKSDAALGLCATDGPSMQCCLSAGLWDAGASIVIGGHHVANWLIGQVRNESQDDGRLRSFAREIGADEESFMSAYREVPCMSRERFGHIAQTLFTLSRQLSSVAYQNVQQARFITERNRAENALRVSEEHFRATIDHAGAGYFRINRRGCFESVNSAWLELHGYPSADEIVGQHFSTTQVEQDLNLAEQIVQEGFAGREFRAGEFTRKLADGSVGFHTFSLHPVREEGQVVALEGFLIDTTSLHRVTADYKMLFDTMLDGFALHEIVCDGAGQPVDYRFLAVNPAFERQTGLKAADLLGRTVLEALPQTERSWIETYGRVALTGEATTFENHSAALNRYFEVSAFCPSPRRFACVFVDITARRLAELELRKLSRAVEQSPVSVVITGTTGAIEYINPYFTATTGYTLEEVRGQTPRVLSSGETPPAVYQDLWRTIAAGSEWRGEFHNKRKDGTLFWEAATIAPIMDDQGRITHYLAVKEDITERKRANAALASSERRFRSLVENVPNIAVQGYDRERRVIFWNAASEALYGYTRAEALGRRLEDLIIPAEMRDGVIAAVEGFVARDEEIPAGELVLRRKDGSLVPVYSSHVKLERSDGEPEMHCIDIDLTPRKAAERALAEAHDFHLRMLSEAPALIWRSGPNAKCNWFNATWLAFTGRSLAEEVGDGWTEGVHPEDFDRCVGIYQTAFGARQPFQMEYRLRRHDGEFRWISDDGIPFKALGGDFGGYIGYCFDITERRRAEEQIREQAALLDVTQDGIVVTNMDRAVTYWNRGAETIYGIPAGEARGRKFEELVYRETPEDYDESWVTLTETGEWSGDRRHCTRAGTMIDVRLRCTAILDSQRKPRSMLVVVSNITDSKRLEAQFLRAQRLESIGSLASGVAHDLNNVLTPILMAVELLRPIAQAKHDQDMLQLMSDSARRGSDIIQQLLLFSRGSDSPRTPLNAGGVIKEVGRLMRETFPRNLVLSVQAPADLWLVEADRTQIHQVVLNLCVNARDAMPAGGRLTVAAENAHVDRDFVAAHGGKRAGAYVRVQIKDTGTGISRENLEKIFDPFFTTKPPGEGTGLGLATVLGIVRSHGGFLDVTSELGEGSTFSFYLPAAQTITEPPAEEDPAAALRGHNELVLVVEDEENIRSLLQRALTSHNYRVLAASDGAEAIGVYASHATEIQLLLTDMMMPVMDGTHTVRALRQLNPNLPVVGISGLPGQHVELNKNPGPKIRLLPKPFTTELALRMVREALDDVPNAATPPA